MKSRFSLFIVSFLMLFQAGKIFSQSFYELKFTDKAGNAYTGFMVYVSESESYVRMAYYNNSEYRVVNMDYTAKTGMLDDGTHYFVMYGANPTYITDYNRGESYNPDTYVWLWSDAQDYGLPYVTDDPNFAEENFKQVDAYTELDPHNFTREYLNQFYSTNEPDFIALLNMVDDSYNSYTNNDVNYNDDNYNNQNTNYNQSNNNSTNGGAVTMHLIIAANTEIPDIGASCEMDKKRMITEMESVTDALGITLKKYIVDGKNLTKSQVENTLYSVSPGSNDIVIYFYTGHGFRWSNQTDQYSNMDFRYNPYTQISTETCMTLSEVNNIIANKGARLTISLADCCNSDIGANARSSERFLTSRSDPNYDEKKLARLFFNAKGNVISCAASPGEVSWCNESDGGFFMFSFFQAFHEEVGYLSDEATWDDILNNTQKYAAYKTSPSGCNGCTAQNAVKNVKVTYN
jgi:hypothetical protein